MDKVDRRSIPYTKKDLVEARKVFQSMPSYKNGTIHSSDHGDYARKLNYPCSQETIDHYIKFFKAVRGDDLIDWERLKVYFRAQHDPYLVGKEYATSFDLNKNEVIDVDEFHLLMKTIRLHDPEKFENKKPVDYDEFVRKADTNKDGKVSVKELIAWLDKASEANN